MVCSNSKCPCNFPDPDGSNPFLMHLAEAVWAMDCYQHRKVQVLAELGASAYGWKHAMKGLQKAIKDHPADYVPAYMAKPKNKED